MITPYRTSTELATTPRQPPLPPERYRPRTQGAHRARRLGGVLAAYGAVGAAMLAAAYFELGLAAIFAPVGVLVLVGLALVVRSHRRTVAAFHRYGDAMALLGAGRVEEAGAALDALIRDAAGAPVLHALLSTGRAVAFLRAGDLARARELFEAVDRSGWLATPMLRPYLGAVLADRAYAAALAGDLDEAERELARARGALSAAQRGHLLPVEVVIALRRGGAGDVVERIDAAWLDAVGVLSPHTTRALRLLRSFALDCAAGGAPDADALRESLASARPHRPGEFDYLVVAWPELRAFLATHGFVAAR